MNAGGGFGGMNGGSHSGNGASEPASDRRIVLGRILVGFNGQTIAERELTPGRFIIGRTPDNDLQIDSKYISRHHAQIITSIHTSVLEDLNSTNGIYVRSKRVRRRMLNDGDVVQIGQHEIMYFDERTNRSRTAFHEIEEDDAQLMEGPMGGDRGHAATLAQDDNRPLQDREEEDEQDELRSP
jgi:general secretion pathway protein A